MPHFICEAPGVRFAPKATITANTPEEAATQYRAQYPDAQFMGVLVIETTNPRSHMPMEHIDRFKKYGIPAALTAAGLVLGLAIAVGAFHLFRTAHGGEIALFTVIVGLLAATYYAGRNLRAHAQRESERLFEGLDAVNSWLSEFEDSVLTIQQDTAHLKRNQLAYTDRDRALVALRRLRRKLHTVARAADPDWAGIGAALDTVRGALGALPEDSPLIGSDEAEKAYQQREGANPGNEQARAYAASLDQHRRAGEAMHVGIEKMLQAVATPVPEEGLKGDDDITHLAPGPLTDWGVKPTEQPGDFEIVKPEAAAMQAEQPADPLAGLPTLVNLLDQFGAKGMIGRRAKVNAGTPEAPDWAMATVLETAVSSYERVTTAKVEFIGTGHHRWMVVA